MRTAAGVTATAVGGLVLALLIPLLLIAALVGSRTLGQQYTATPVSIGDLPPPAPFSGVGDGCTAADPTGGRCLTPAARHAHDEITRIFGPPGAGAPIRSAACWDAHTWNPSSDHSRGRACDYFPTNAGRFPHGPGASQRLAARDLAPRQRHHAEGQVRDLAGTHLVTEHPRRRQRMGTPLHRRRHLQPARRDRRPLGPHPRLTRQLMLLVGHRPRIDNWLRSPCPLPAAHKRASEPPDLASGPVALALSTWRQGVELSGQVRDLPTAVA